ncbi:MAG TPA: YeeE/YedE family protein [Pseudolabrys sp.]|nr:YeeE/YedE family protein [Pseudolabrys sp.]
MPAFDPVSALLGGGLIGLASVLLMLLNGRVAGISGILGGALALSAGDKVWRLAFIAGLIVAPIVIGLFGYPLPEPQMPASWLLIVAAGVLVGFGARYGGGCTSGHGVCGIARLSARSIAATAIFMASAIIVVAIMRHGFGG